MSPEFIAILVLVFAVLARGTPMLGFLRTIHRDISGLRERMARIEGLFEGFTQLKPTDQ